MLNCIDIDGLLDDNVWIDFCGENNNNNNCFGFDNTNYNITSNNKMNGTTSANSTNKDGGGGISPSDLSNMLRRSADIVDRKEFHPLLYQTMKALTAYAGEYADGGISTATNGAASASVPQQKSRRGSGEQPTTTTTTNTTQKERDPPGKKKGAFDDVPDDILDGKSGGSTGGLRASTTSSTSAGGGAAAAAERVGASGGQFASAANAAGNKSDQQKAAKGWLNTPLKGIKKGIEKLGTDVHKFVGEHNINEISGGANKNGGSKEES